MGATIIDIIEEIPGRGGGRQGKYSLALDRDLIFLFRVSFQKFTAAQSKILVGHF